MTQETVLPLSPPPTPTEELHLPSYPTPVLLVEVKVHFLWKKIKGWFACSNIVICAKCQLWLRNPTFFSFVGKQGYSVTSLLSYR